MSGLVVELSERWTQLLQKLVYELGYEDEAEVVDVALQLLEQCACDPEFRRQRFSQMTREGMDQLDAGQGIPIESDSDLERLFAEINGKVDARLGKVPRT